MKAVKNTQTEKARATETPEKDIPQMLSCLQAVQYDPVSQLSEPSPTKEWT